VRDGRYADVRAHPVQPMTFTASIQQFALKVEQRAKAVHINTAIELQRSIKFGSAITGAPPIPVAASNWDAAGALRDSVTLRYPDEHTALVFTTKWYAPEVEDNAKGVQFHSGAPHGWKMTIAAFSRVVDTVATRTAGAK
jgi:hypothetical protein